MIALALVMANVIGEVYAAADAQQPIGPGGEPCGGLVCAAGEYCAVLRNGEKSCMQIGVAAGRPYVVNGTRATPLLRLVRRGVSSASDDLGAWALNSSINPHVGSGKAHPWAATKPPKLSTSLRAPQRRAVAEWWSNAASAEYASIASFSEHALQLLAVGAPARLVQGALAAASDEVKHAQLSFEMAAMYADLDAVAPASLPISCSDSHSKPPSRASLALAAARDGCVAETLAAAEAAAAAAKAQNAYVAAALRSIAVDEARHAALGWEAVAWATEGDEAATRQVVHLIEHAMAAPTPPLLHSTADDASDEADLEAHGVLSATSKARVRSVAMQQVISPALMALASGTSPSPAQIVADRLSHFVQ